MKVKNVTKLALLGVVSTLLMGCGNAIPEMTDVETTLIVTYASDVTLGHIREKQSRLIDTEKETVRRAELAEKIKNFKKKALEEKQQEEEMAQEADSSNGSNQPAAAIQGVESMADFIGLDEGLQVSYDGYEIKKSYSDDEAEEWEPTFDATTGKNLLIVKLKVTNQAGEPAVADVMSKEMLFSINGDNKMGGMALMTMLLNDFAFAKDEIGAGESKRYVLITQIDENITETASLSLHMKKGGESMTVKLQ